VAGLKRVVNAVKAIVDDQSTQRAEMEVDRGVDIDRQEPARQEQRQRDLRSAQLEQAHRHRDEQEGKEDLHRVANVVRRVQLGRRVVNFVDRPPPAGMLHTVSPIGEEVRHHEKQQELQREADGP
jgi:hypothetical protein